MPFLSTDPIGPMLRKWTDTDQEQVRNPAAVLKLGWSFVFFPATFRWNVKAG